MKRVLLLNRSEEVVDVISWQRAVILMLQNKASCPYKDIETIDIKTVSGIFRLPTVLILVQYVRIPYKRAAVTKENVLKRDKFTCQYCGRHIGTTQGTIDHVIPRTKGGQHNWTNVVAACKQCNNRKDDLMLAEAERRYGMKLISKPFVPSRGVLLLTATDVLTNKTWSKWILLDH